MQEIPKERFDLMGNFHNDVVSLIDETKLTPPEVLAVLEMIINRIRQLMELSKGVDG